MKIGAMVPQGWRMDLHGIDPKHQWDISKSPMEYYFRINQKNRKIKI